MSWIESLLTQIEARLRIMIEGDGGPDGFPRKLHRQLQQDLILVMKSNAQPLTTGTKADLPRSAPDQYTLVLPAVQAQMLMTHPAELDRLAHKLENVAAQVGIAFRAAPILRVVADPQLMEMNILSEYSQPRLDNSSTFQLARAFDSPDHAQGDQLPKSFLIVNGLSTYQITSPVINIGRDASNQLQLDNPQISRQHAQLRFIQGRFVIFDLDSRSGTFVNGVAITSHTLNPGDVILLANLPLVFGQESSMPVKHTQELPASKPPPEVL
jgi:hypothetical protein